MAARGFALEWLPAKWIIVAIGLNTCIRRGASLIRNLDEHCERVNVLGRHGFVTPVNCPAVRFPLPAVRLPPPGSRLPAPAFRFPLSAFRCPFPVTCFPLPASRFLFPVVGRCWQRTTGDGKSGVWSREAGGRRQEPGAGRRATVVPPSPFVPPNRQRSTVF